MQCLKVHRAMSSLLIHTRFDDVTRLRGWNKFRGLRVYCLKTQPRCVITRTTPTGNKPEAPELGTPRYKGQNVGSQWCPL